MEGSSGRTMMGGCINVMDDTTIISVKSRMISGGWRGARGGSRRLRLWTWRSRLQQIDPSRRQQKWRFQRPNDDGRVYRCCGWDNNSTQQGYNDFWRSCRCTMVSVTTAIDCCMDGGIPCTSVWVNELKVFGLVDSWIFGLQGVRGQPYFQRMFKKTVPEIYPGLNTRCQGLGSQARVFWVELKVKFFSWHRSHMFWKKRWEREIWLLSFGQKTPGLPPQTALVPNPK